jgi:hypothetical protein
MASNGNQTTYQTTSNDSIYTLNSNLTYADIKPYLKTGDIIMFYCDKHENFFADVVYKMRTKLLDSKFGHAGLIVKSANDFYLVEVATRDHPGNGQAYFLNQKNEGVRIIPLDIALKTYNDVCQGAYAVKFAETELSSQCLIKNLPKYSTQTFESFTALFMLGFVDIVINHGAAEGLIDKISSMDKLMCTEFLYSILNDCGIVKDFTAKLFWPHYLRGTSFDQFSNVKYSQPVVFYYKDPALTHAPINTTTNQTYPYSAYYSRY